MGAGRLWAWLERALKAVLLATALGLLAVNYASYVRVVGHTRLGRAPNATQTAPHVNWRSTRRDPFQPLTPDPTTQPEKGLIAEFIELVAPTEKPEAEAEALAANNTESDPLAVENAISLERDTGE